MEDTALIFIPDISGFTKFVTETEINHSQHIIKELIEVIVKSLSPEFIVSEIEGDAVLTYHFGDPPSYNKIFEMTKKIFLNFHSQLRIIERDNVCSCGACTGSSNLTLKFITHFGKLKEVDVANFKKIIGSDVILSHRLLKNRIPLHEYLLFTKHFFKAQTVKSNETYNYLVENIEEIENFGKIETLYLDLSPLITEVPLYPKIKRITAGKVLDVLSIIINAPIDFVYSKLVDTKGKINWVKNIKNIQDTNLINRVNSVHICNFDNMDLSLTTKSIEFNEDEYFFQEEVEMKENIKFVNDYHLIRSDKTTKLDYKIIYNDLSGEPFFVKFMHNFKLKMILKSMIASQELNLLEFKNFCEREYIKTN